MSPTPLRLAAVALAATLAAAVQAQPEVGSGVDLGAAPPPDPAPSSEAVAAPGQVPLPNGVFSLELLLGTGGTGGGGGLRVSLGFENGEGWRLELAGGGWAENGSPGGTGGELQVGRVFGEVAVGRRFGRVEPWVALGVAALSADGTMTRGDSICIPGTPFCGDYQSVTADGTGEATGAALAAGVRFALTDHLLLGVVMRKMLVGQVALPGYRGGLGEVDAGAPWFGANLAYRFGGGR